MLFKIPLEQGYGDYLSPVPQQSYGIVPFEPTVFCPSCGGCGYVRVAATTQPAVTVTTAFPSQSTAATDSTAPKEGDSWWSGYEYAALAPV